MQSELPSTVQPSLSWGVRAEWRPALKWGIGIALLHRLVLLVWLACVWQILAPYTDHPADFQSKPKDRLPALESNAEQLMFGVLRRWDANHYLNLAQNGYRTSHTASSVFAPLAPLSFYLLDQVLPGPVDAGAMVFETAAFALALVLLFRLCETYYGDPELARWSVVVLALLPISYFFAAPLSESIYLAMALGVFWASLNQHWWLAALCCLLAALARTQGAALAGVAGIILLQYVWPRHTTLRARLWEAFRLGWPLAFTPAAVVLYDAYRTARDLLPLSEAYPEYSYVFFVNPVEGLYFNLRWMVHHTPEWMTLFDPWAMMLCLPLGLLMLRYPQHRRLPLVVYTWGYLILFLGKMNWEWGTDEIIFTQSFARYALSLFPLIVMVVDGYRRTPRRFRNLFGLALGVLGFLLFSGLSVAGLPGP